MSTRLIIDGNAVYEIDEDCLECKKREQQKKESRSSCGRREREHSCETKKKAGNGG